MSFQKKILITILFLLSVKAYAQREKLQQITPKSPNIASFEKFTDVPVNLGSGAVQVGIPIYDIKIGNLTIPIALSYNNNGLKCDEIPSWVGLGWNLSTGGYISYHQNGLNDFASQNGLFPNGLYSLNRYFASQMSDQEKRYFFEDIIAGNLDSEYDEYYYNFPGNSGAFHFTSPTSARTSPATDLKIVKTAAGFSVVDDSGNKFFFESQELITSVNALDISANFSDNSAFYITKIVTAENREVNFTYRTYHLNYSKTNSHLEYNNSVNQACGDPSTFSQSTTLTTINYLLPDEIQFGTGYAKFNHSNLIREDLKKIDPNTNTPYLTGISIYNAEGKIKEFQFDMSYFGSNDRLKLNAVREIALNQQPKIWSLNYYSSASASVPPIFSKSKDHWGYYNGINNSNDIPRANYSTLIPYYNNFYTPAAVRTSDFSFAKLGMLQSIQYPTGGYSEFIYEQNQLSFTNYSDFDFGPFLEMPGGNSYSQTIVAESATTGNSISGSFAVPAGGGYYKVISYKILSPDPFYNDPTIVFSGGNSTSTSLLNSKMNQCNFSLHQCTSDEVIFLNEGTYNYSIQGTYYVTNQNSTYYLYAGLEIRGSEPGAVAPYPVGGGRIAKIVSSIQANTPSIIKKFIYDDNISNIRFINVPNYLSETKESIANSQNNSTSTCLPCGIRYNVHEESVKPFVGATIEYGKVTEYRDEAGTNGKIERTFNFSENIGGSTATPVVSPINTSWRAGTISSEKVYQFNLSNPKSITNTGYTSNFLGTQINGIRVGYDEYCPVNFEQRTYKVNLATLISENFKTSSVTEQLTEPSGQILNNDAYAYNFSSHQKPNAATHNTSDSQQKIEKTKYVFDYNTSLSGVNGEAQGLILLKNKNMNLPIEVLSIKTINNIDYVIGGSLQTFKINSSVPEKSYLLDLAEPIAFSNFQQSSIDGGGSFIMDSRYKIVVIYDIYDAKNNLLQQHLVDGPPTCYLYSYNKQYPIAEIKNADYATVESILGAGAIESFSNQVSPDKAAVDAFLAPLKTGLPAAFISSYTYQPLVGMTSQTDAKGMTTYYEYDEFQRLKYVKDQDGNIVKSNTYHYKN